MDCVERVKLSGGPLCLPKTGSRGNSPLIDTIPLDWALRRPIFYWITDETKLQ